MAFGIRTAVAISVAVVGRGDGAVGAGVRQSQRTLARCYCAGTSFRATTDGHIYVARWSWAASYIRRNCKEDIERHSGRSRIRSVLRN